jgi:hypothetical protein
MFQMFKALMVVGALAGALVLGGVAPIQASGSPADTVVSVDAPTDAVLVYGPYYTALGAGIKAGELERAGYDTRIVFRNGSFYVLAE